MWFGKGYVKKNREKKNNESWKKKSNFIQSIEQASSRKIQVMNKNNIF